MRETAVQPSTGYPAVLEDKLRLSGVRLTAHRVSIAKRLFLNGHRHVTAEGLYGEVIAGGRLVSLATIYNTLHCFTKAGLLRQVFAGGSNTYFDTNTAKHHHFLIEGTNKLIDFDEKLLEMVLPHAPAGMVAGDVQVVVRIRHERC